MKNDKYFIVKNSGTSSLPIAYIKPMVGQQYKIYSSEVYGEGWNFQNGLYNYEPYIGVKPKLVDFFTLHPDTPNALGTVQRFTSITGNYYDQSDGLFKDIDGNTLGTQTLAFAFPDNYFIDHVTGYGTLANTFYGGQPYNDFIGTGGTLNGLNTGATAGYSDWRGMTILENKTLDNYNLSILQSWDPNSNNVGSFGSITTYPTTTTAVINQSSQTGGNNAVAKTNNGNFKIIRDHYFQATPSYWTKYPEGSTTSRISYANVDDAWSFGSGGTDVPFTIEGEFRFGVSTSTYQWLLNCRDGGTTDYQWELVMLGPNTSSGSITFVLTDGTNANYLRINGSKTFQYDSVTTQKIKVTYDGSKLDSGLKLYVNDVEDTAAIVSTGGTYTGTTNIGAQLTIGSSESFSSSFRFFGYMRNIKITKNGVETFNLPMQTDWVDTIGSKSPSTTVDVSIVNRNRTFK